VTGQLGLFGRLPPEPPEPTEGEKRDHALDVLRRHRGEIIEAAVAVAVHIATERGRVTSTEVLAIMRLDAEWAAKVEAADRRFMGPVFRRKMWTRLGWEETGSHGRPVAIWALTSAASKSNKDW